MKLYQIPMFVKAAGKDNADEIFAILDPESGGAKTFSVALSFIGDNTIKAWGANYYEMDEALYNAIKTATNNQFKAFVDSFAAQHPERPLPSSVIAFKQNIVIGNPGEDFYAFIAANGYKVPVEARLK